MNRVSRTVSFVSQAQADLDAALATGADTTEARERLRLAEEELAAAKAAQAEADAAAQAEAGTILKRLVDEELKAATRAMNAQLADLASIVPPKVTLPVAPLENYLKARNRLDEAKSAQAAHQAKMDELNGRLHALVGERQAISDRRAAGVRNDAVDGPALALLNSDIEGLRALIERTQAEAPREVDAQATELSRVAAGWGDAQSNAVAEALNAHCHALEAALIEAASRLKAKFPIGYVGQRYRPSERLKTACMSGVV